MLSESFSGMSPVPAAGEQGAGSAGETWHTGPCAPPPAACEASAAPAALMGIPNLVPSSIPSRSPCGDTSLSVLVLGVPRGAGTNQEQRAPSPASPQAPGAPCPGVSRGATPRTLACPASLFVGLPLGAELICVGTDVFCLCDSPPRAPATSHCPRASWALLEASLSWSPLPALPPGCWLSRGCVGAHPKAWRTLPRKDP